jgi:beta-fructofuranosidase
MNNPTSFTLEKAAAFIREHAPQVEARYKGRYHFSAPFGWINDPNGFCFFQGRYHLFYQYHPYSAVWGPMYWGHAVSADLITWEHLPPALAPDTAADSGGCFSGTALVEDGRLFLLYTGVCKDGAGNVVQQQCLAWSNDGLSFTKADTNPVIPASLLPPGFRASEFRDPKLWSEGGRYYCIVSAADAEGQGHLLLFSSTDLQRGWGCEGDYLTGLECFAGMWECPDRFSLDEKELLLLSVICSPADTYPLPGSHGSLWAALKVADSRFCTTAFDVLDKGFDFYAPQTILTPDGRRIMIAWIGAWANTLPTAPQGWAGSMSLPRELSFVDGRLLQKPAREIEAYLEPLESFSGLSLQGSLTLKSAPCMEIALEAEPGGKETFSLDFFAAGNKKLRLSYDPGEEAFIIDRTNAGLPVRKLAAGEQDRRVIPCRTAGGTVRLRAFIDISSVEIFAGDGELVFTSLVFPEEEEYGVGLHSDSPITITKLVSHSVRSML